MRNILASALSGMLLLLLALPAGAGEPIAYRAVPSIEIVKPWKNPVVQLDGGCTAFHIGDGTYISAGHCPDKMSGKITFTDGMTRGVKLAIFYSPRAGQEDIAVYKLLVANNDTNALKLRCGAVAPKVGDEVHVTGYPAQFGRATVYGRVASEAFTEKLFGGVWDKDLIKLDIASFGGFSGSPVMDAENEVVGILVGSMPEQHNLSVMQPIDRVCEILSLSGA